MLSVLAVPAAMADPAMNPTRSSANVKTNPLFKPFISMPPFRHGSSVRIWRTSNLHHLCSRLPHHLPPLPAGGEGVCVGGKWGKQFEAWPQIAHEQMCYSHPSA